MGSKTHRVLLADLTLVEHAGQRFKSACPVTGFLLDVLAPKRRQPAAFCERDLTVSDLASLEQTILADIAAAGDEASLETVRVAALGKKGSISALLSTLGKMSPDERKTQGAAINLAKDKVTQALTARRDILKSAALDARLASETIDVTLPVRETPAEAGRIHPLSQVFEEVATIFADMGFAIAEGPDIETDDYNFTKLNFPEGHPAREMHDTFFFNPKEDGSRMLL